MKDFKSLDFFGYVGILWRRKWYVVTVFVLVSAGTALYAWRRPLIYRSETRILVEQPTISEEYVRQSDPSTPEQQAANLRQQVQSQSFLAPVVEQMQLFGYGANSDFSMDLAVTILRSNVQVTATGGNVVILSYAAADPQVARDVAQRLADSLVRKNVTYRRDRAVDTKQFLEDELVQAQRELAGKEDQVKQFKMSHLGQLPEQATANMSALTLLHTRLASADDAIEQAKGQKKLLDFRTQEQRRLDTLSRGVISFAAAPAAGDAAQANPQLAAKRAELAQLIAKYTPKHPDVVRAAKEVEELERQQKAASAMNPGPEGVTPLGQDTPSGQADANPKSGEGDAFTVDAGDAELRLEAEALNEEISKRQKERGEILRQISDYQARLNLAPALEQELGTLVRDVEVLKSRYTSLLSKKFQAQMTENLETSRNYVSYRVVDEATLPPLPAFPNRAQMILMGLGMGLVLGLGAALGREYLDPTLRSEDEAVAVLGLPVLVSVPELKESARKGRQLLGGGREAA